MPRRALAHALPAPGRLPRTVRAAPANPKAMGAYIPRMEVTEVAWRLGVALALGLFVGLERERNKGSGPGRGSAGVLTFALVALLGGVVVGTEIDAFVAVATAFVGAAALVSYVVSSSDDPGLTSEVTLVITFALGALAQSEPALAAGTGVVVTVLLASRAQLHRFVSEAISDRELGDLLLFTVAVLVILPLVPDRGVGPFGGVNPRTVWRLVVLVMVAGGVGYISLRLLGPRFGLPLTGLAGGFISSTATIASMGVLARRDRTLQPGAIAGAVLSSVATIVQIAIILASSSDELLQSLWPALAGSGVVAVAFAGISLWRLRGARAGSGATDDNHAFDLKSAVVFALTISVVTLAASALQDWLGDSVVPVTAALSGFADAHAATAGMAALVSGGKIDPSLGAVSVLLALTTNTTSKAIAAFLTGGWSFAVPVILGLGAIVTAAWAGILVTRLTGW